MNEYELINYSDSYTFLADGQETAALMIFCLESPMYGVADQEGNMIVPIFAFFDKDAKEWYREKFDRSPDEGFAEKKEEVKKALASVMLGDFEDRKRYQAALLAITDEDKKKEFIEIWQDGRSSLNDIGTYCHEMAEKL